MLSHPTFELLRGLGLHGMADGYKSLETNPEAGSLTHAEWLGIILEHEKTLREQKRFETRAPRPPTCVTPPASRTSTTALTAASTAPCSSSSPAATGSAPGATW